MMRALLARELRLAWRSGAEILNPLWFFLIVITLFPFGVGAAPQLLAQIAPGVVWVAALLAALVIHGIGCFATTGRTVPWSN